VAIKMGHAFLFLDECKESLIVVSTSCCAVTKKLQLKMSSGMPQISERNPIFKEAPAVQ
jgi:hypothetical protein